MGRTVRVDLSKLAETIERDLEENVRNKVEEAIDETGEDSVGIVWTRVPFAFGELHNSIHYDKARHALIADAPHAAPVEVGSVPHFPPVEPLKTWCTMKGFADPESAAWAIANKIAREGTKPTHYMRGSLPDIRGKLDANIRKALRK